MYEEDSLGLKQVIDDNATYYNGTSTETRFRGEINHNEVNIIFENQLDVRREESFLFYEIFDIINEFS